MKALFEHWENWTAALGLLLLAPALWFISANLLKYELNLAPGLEVEPIHPAILLGGLGLALLLNLLSVLDWKAQRMTGHWSLRFDIARRPLNLTVLVLAGAGLAALLLYAVMENVAHA